MKDADGNQVDVRDPFRFWYMPIFYQSKDPINKPYRPDMKLEDLELVDCLTRHARLDILKGLRQPPASTRTTRPGTTQRRSHSHDDPPRPRGRGRSASSPAWLCAWNRFWFAAVDPTGLGFMRICCGLLVFYNTLIYSYDLMSYVGPNSRLDAPDE